MTPTTRFLTSGAAPMTSLPFCLARSPRRLQAVLVGGLAGDGEGVGVLGHAVREDLQARGEGDGEGVLHLALLGGLRLRVEVVQQGALVLGEQIDVAALEGGDEDLAGAEVGADLRLYAGGFEHGRVQVAEYLVLGEVGGADGDAVLAGAAS